MFVNIILHDIEKLKIDSQYDSPLTTMKLIRQDDEYDRKNYYFESFVMYYYF